MKIEDQVCTLEQAKKLKELGINDSLFYYREYKSSRPEYSGWKILPKVMHDVEWEYGLSAKGRIEPHIETVRNTYACGEFPYGSAGELFPAYTVAELGQMLPDYLTIDSYRMHPHFYKQEQRRSPALWTATYGKAEDKDVRDFDFNNEAQCRAALLIYLIESKLTTTEETNKRLNQ